jgi:hypothetical protein
MLGLRLARKTAKLIGYIVGGAATVAGYLSLAVEI